MRAVFNWALFSLWLSVCEDPFLAARAMAKEGAQQWQRNFDLRLSPAVGEGGATTIRETCITSARLIACVNCVGLYQELI